MSVNKLNEEEIKESVEKLISNADNLTEESAILFQAAKYARAFTLSHLAREELSKVVMLMALDGKLKSNLQIDWNSFWKRFRNHKAKITNSEIWLLSMSGLNSSVVSIEMVDSYAKALNDLKNNSLYVSHNEQGVLDPAEVINEDKARISILSARLLFELLRDMWINHQKMDWESASTVKEEIRHYMNIVEQGSVEEIRSLYDFTLSSAHGLLKIINSGRDEHHQL
ncbi:MAG: AbiV family abortive infection protein [Cyanobacteria bacterium J06626_4]